MSATITKSRPTIKDVAELAGVRHPSVSAVLNGAKGQHVAPATRERILKAAEEIGYRRNGGIVAARTGKYGCAALLLSTDQWKSNLPPEMQNAIHDELAKANMHLILNRLPVAALSSERELPKILREWMCDGLLVDVTHGIPSYLVEAIERHSVPSVWLNVKRSHACVYPDDFGAGERAGNLLLSAGCQSLVYVGMQLAQGQISHHYSVDDRADGVRRSAQSAGARYSRVDQLVWASFEDRKRPVVELISRLERPAGFVTYSPKQAELVLRAAEESGLRVPEDLALVTFANLPSEIFQYELTCFLVPDAEVGKQAADMLMRKVADPDRRETAMPINFGFFAGNTCPASAGTT